MDVLRRNGANAAQGLGVRTLADGRCGRRGGRGRRADRPARLRAVVFDPLETFGGREAVMLGAAGVEIVGRARSVRGALAARPAAPEMLVTVGGIPAQSESWSFFGRAADVDPALSASS